MESFNSLLTNINQLTCGTISERIPGLIKHANTFQFKNSSVHFFWSRLYFKHEFDSKNHNQINKISTCGKILTAIYKRNRFFLNFTLLSIACSRIKIVFLSFYPIRMMGIYLPGADSFPGR